MNKSSIKKSKTNEKIFEKSLLFLLFFLLFLLFFAKMTGFGNFLQKKHDYFDDYSKKPVFQCGETLNYKIYYGKQNKRTGMLLAGYAELSIIDSISNGKIIAHKINGSGKTTNLFSLFLKVRHSYTSLIDPFSLESIKFSIKIKEGKYQTQETRLFERNDNINDILGAFYKLRTIHPKELSSKDTVFFSYYYGGKTYQSYFINKGSEFIKTKFGSVETIKCEPLLEVGRLFKSTTGATVWVSADKTHIPIKLEIPLLVGSIYINLVSYENAFLSLNK